MRRHEQATQIATMNFLNTALIPPAFAFHIPNGGKRTHVEAQILKAMGVRAGMPDLFVIAPAKTFLAIEMKAEHGRASKEQKERMDALRDCGVSTAICKSLVEVQDAVLAAGIRLRARVEI